MNDNFWGGFEKQAASRTGKEIAKRLYNSTPKKLSKLDSESVGAINKLRKINPKKLSTKDFYASLRKSGEKGFQGRKGFQGHVLENMNGLYSDGKKDFTDLERVSKAWKERKLTSGESYGIGITKFKQSHQPVTVKSKSGKFLNLFKEKQKKAIETKKLNIAKKKEQDIANFKKQLKID